MTIISPKDANELCGNVTIQPSIEEAEKSQAMTAAEVYGYALGVRERTYAELRDAEKREVNAQHFGYLNALLSIGYIVAFVLTQRWMFLAGTAVSMSFLFLAIFMLEVNHKWEESGKKLIAEANKVMNNIKVSVSMDLIQEITKELNDENN
jgi:hypothetical protein